MNILKVSTLIPLTIALLIQECRAYEPQGRDDAEKIEIAVVESKSATIPQKFPCRINSKRHIKIRTPVEGYVAAIPVKEGQAVKRGDLLLQVEILLDKEKPSDESRGNAVDFKAPFDGLVGRLPFQEGSLVLKGETLTTLSDNSVMSVSFNVSEALYLEYMAERGKNPESPSVELILADENSFSQAGKIVAIDADFNTNGGTVPFRADFPNPDGLLRNGQRGTLVLNRSVNDVILIPRVAAAISGPRVANVYVVDEDHIAHLREIVTESQTEELMVVKKGIKAGERIIVKGIRGVREGARVE